MQVSSYNEREFNEGPRICGGAIFLKFMKKGKCGSPLSKKDQISFLTSTSSSLSPTLNDRRLQQNLYDPTNQQYCMPRQIEGASTSTLKEQRDDSKLDFKLRPLERAISSYDRDRNNQGTFSSAREGPEESICIDDAELSQSVVQFDPNFINDLKTKHLRSMNGRKEMDQNSEFEKSAEPSGVDASADEVDVTWNDPQSTRINQKQGQHLSKVRVMRKEMSSFRKELDAVKNSLPTQAQTPLNEDHYILEDEHWERTNVFASTDRKQDTFTHRSEIDSKESSEQDVWKKIDMFSLNRKNAECRVGDRQFNSNVSSDQDDVWKESSTVASQQTKQVSALEKSEKYFKSEWDFKFKDQERHSDKKTEKNHPDAENSVKSEKQTLKQSEERTGSETTADENLVTKPSEMGSAINTNDELSANEPNKTSMAKNDALPATTTKSEQHRDTNEIPFDGTKIEEEVENQKESDKRNQSAGISSTMLTKSELTELERLEAIHIVLQREKAKCINSDSIDSTHYDEDLKIVKKLLKKYKTPGKTRVGGPKHAHPAIGAPTDAWFHRHAMGSAGMQRKIEKTSGSIGGNTNRDTSRRQQVENEVQNNPVMHRKTEKTSNSIGGDTNRDSSRLQRENNEINDSSLRDRSTLRQGSKTGSSQNVNRVRFAISDSQPANTDIFNGSSASMGKMSDRIKFWESNRP